MYPWLWFWAPQIHFPLSGSVWQDYKPNTTWFSDLIKPESGNARIEERVFSVASYGTQLGLITKVLLEIAEQAEKESAKALPPSQSMQDLRKLQADIASIKKDEHESAAARLVAEVDAVRERGGAEYEELAKRLLPLLERKGA